MRGGAFFMYTGLFFWENPQEVVRVPHDGAGPGVAWVGVKELGEETANLIHQYMTSPDGFA